MKSYDPALVLAVRALPPMVAGPPTGTPKREPSPKNKARDRDRLSRRLKRAARKAKMPLRAFAARIAADGERGTHDEMELYAAGWLARKGVF